MADEQTGFPDEPTFNLAALAGQEQLQERIRDLENERAGLGRELAAEPERCEHAFASHHVPRHRLYWVRQCLLCHEVDWDDLDAEVDGIVRDVLSSLAAELEAEAERELAYRGDSIARVVGPSVAATFRAAARMARERAGVAVERTVVPPVGDGDHLESPAAHDAAQRVPASVLALLKSHADEEEATVTYDPTHERDKGLFVAGMRRAIDLIEHGDRPAEAGP